MGYNLDDSNTDASFTFEDVNSFLSPYEILPNSSRKQIFREIFLFYDDIVCCVYSKESPWETYKGKEKNGLPMEANSFLNFRNTSNYFKD